MMATPTITRINPTSGPTTGGTPVIISGSNLASPSAVTFGGTPATINSSSATSVSVTTPANTAGAVQVVVTTSDGTSVQPVNFTYTNIAAPYITSLFPADRSALGKNTVTINGANLQYTTGVTFGSTPASSFTILSDVQIAAVAPEGTVGATTVSVTNGAGTSGTLSYIYNVAAPVVTSVSPSSGPTAGGNTAVISGTGFTFATAVTFGSTAATSFTVVSSTAINAVVPPGSGAVSVHVTGPGGTSTGGPTYTYVAAPVVSSVSPSSGPTAGGNTVVISGTGFTNATAVTFGSTAATSFTVVSSTAINAVVPPGSGAVSVHVTGPGGTSTGGPTYTYTAVPPPTITGLTPASGPVSGGNTVTITGLNLNSATAVTFGGNSASSFTTLSPTQINATAPPGTAGAAAVVVTTPAGASAGFNYTYIGAPAPIAVFPTTGVTAGGDSVTIIGSGFTGTTSVIFGTTPATSFTVVGDTELDAVTPLHLAGTVPINIATPGGTDSSLSFSFQPSPVISSIAPTAGPTTGGTVVTITGAGLINTVAVYFGGTAATAFTVNSDNSVTATSSAEAAGARAVTVDTAAATSNGATFLYTAVPTLTSLSPTSGPVAGGNNVTLAGTGFTTATDVVFGANPALFSILSDLLISSVAPPGIGAVSVTVVNPGGTSGAKTYTYS